MYLNNAYKQRISCLRLEFKPAKVETELQSENDNSTVTGTVPGTVDTLSRRL